jgi:hypothetical protein
MGGLDETIYTAYWRGKLGRENTPPLPKETVQGSIIPSGEEFILNSIYYNGWDGRNFYEAARAFPGFDTKEYEKVDFLTHFSPDSSYREKTVYTLLKKHPNLNTGDIRQRLFAYTRNR